MDPRARLLLAKYRTELNIISELKEKLIDLGYDTPDKLESAMIELINEESK